MDFQAFMTLHTDIPREAPGSDDATRAALRSLPRLPPNPRVFDLGCGPGRSTFVLARELGVPIVAVDTHMPYLDRLEETARKMGLSRLIETRCADMARFREDPGTIDLIWSEGAIYILGFERGLKIWSPLLKPGGLCVVTELVWFTAGPPDVVRTFWENEYPDMTTETGCVQRAANAGFDMITHFRLTKKNWFTEYLDPLTKRANQLRMRADLDMIEVIEGHEKEVEMVNRYGDTFGYSFFVMRKRS